MSDVDRDDWAFGNGGFAKLYGDRLKESSLLDCAPATRWIFLWILSQADAEGRYRCASIKGLARAAAVSFQDADVAIRELSEPDPDSTTSDNEGRRIERIQGGWKVINYRKYRDYQTKKQRDDAERAKRYREKQRDASRDVTPPSRENRDLSVTPRDIRTKHQTSDTKHQTPDRSKDLANQQQSPTLDPYSPNGEQLKGEKEIARAHLAVINGIEGRRLSTLSPDVTKKVKARLKDWSPAEIVAAPIVIWATHPDSRKQKHSPEVYLRDGESPKTRNGQTYGGYYWMSRAYEKADSANLDERAVKVVRDADEKYHLGIEAMLRCKGFTFLEVSDD